MCRSSKQKERELYRLLALLDANRYEENSLQQEAFVELYNNQELVGRRTFVEIHLARLSNKWREVDIAESARIGRVREIDLVSVTLF